MWPSVPYRILVPMALTLVALGSGVAVALTTFSLVARHVEANAEAETRRLASTLARALVQPVLRGDVWQAFQLLKAATHEDRGPPGDTAVRVVVLDAKEYVFVSPTPRDYPMGTHLSALPPAMIEAARAVIREVPPATARSTQDSPPLLVLAAPVMGDEDVLLGVVMATHPPGISEAQRGSVVQRLSFLGILAMVVVALAGGAMGMRLTAPLARLRLIMRDTPRKATVREQLSSTDLAEVCQRPDEVGDLARGFAAMLRQIVASQEIERHMLEAERLASIGQLSAGIAHEVNNPLGGMLAAVHNRRLRGGLDPATERTLNMLERALHQVHETIQALLNEARSEQRPLQDADLHDLELLLRPEAEHLGTQLAWSVKLPPQARLPAVAIRQVLLNLSLNAAAAAGRKGQVRVWSEHDNDHWRVSVGNTGPVLAADRLVELTTVAQRSSEGRLGLGLWITARILHTLGGQLCLAPKIPSGLSTVIVATLPLAPPDERVAALTALSAEPDCTDAH